MILRTFFYQFSHLAGVIIREFCFHVASGSRKWTYRSEYLPMCDAAILDRRLSELAAACGHSDLLWNNPLGSLSFRSAVLQCALFPYSCSSSCTFPHEVAHPPCRSNSGFTRCLRSLTVYEWWNMLIISWKSFKRLQNFTKFFRG